MGKNYSWQRWPDGRSGSGRRGPERLPSSAIVHDGSLEMYGYSLEKGEDARHEALDKALRAYGYEETVRKLAALEGVNKGRPELHRKVKEDIVYPGSLHYRLFVDGKGEGTIRRGDVADNTYIRGKRREGKVVIVDDKTRSVVVRNAFYSSSDGRMITEPPSRAS